MLHTLVSPSICTSRLFLHLRRKINPSASLSIGDDIKYLFRDGHNKRIVQGRVLALPPGLIVVSEFGTNEYWEIDHEDVVDFI